jgi:enoyl-CoA hydratase
MTTSNDVSLAVENGTAIVQINRESTLNALDLEVLTALLRTTEELNDYCRGDKAYSDCRCVLLQGAGEKAFVAGADIKLMQKANPAQLRSFAELGQQVMHAFETLPLPVIAVIQGFALGGGMELALACDLILAGENAKFGQPEVNLGLLPGFGGTQRLSARCGAGTAKRLIFTAETISAAEALRVGLADYLVPNSELKKKAAELAQTISGKGPLAIAAAKRAIYGFYNCPLEDGLKKELEEFIAVFSSRDSVEGLAAFVEKRKAEFNGN